MRKSFTIMLTLGLLGWVTVGQATAQVQRRGDVTILNVPSQEAQGDQGVDYVNARPMRLPAAPSRSEAEAHQDLLSALTSWTSLGAAGAHAGATGTGEKSPVFLGVPNTALNDDDDVAPQEHGTNNHPFSTARADLSPTATNTAYPYRASGKLFFNIGQSTFVCSASLIKRGLVVTAAHCVAEFGQRRFHTNFRFVPGHRNNVAPFGTWTANTVVVLTSYFNGTDPCSVAGIVCRNDIAVIRVNPQAGRFPGTATGFYGFGFNGFGFTGSGLTHITQIGYPVCLNNGQFMQRNDSQGFRSAPDQNNTRIGSLMCGGSSGGPWVLNFGIRPALTGTTNGTFPNPNIVVGVTSWGFVSSLPKQQGASPFLSTNIVPLVNTACETVPPPSHPACL